MYIQLLQYKAPNSNIIFHTLSVSYKIFFFSYKYACNHKDLYRPAKHKLHGYVFLSQNLF